MDNMASEKKDSTSQSFFISSLFSCLTGTPVISVCKDLEAVQLDRKKKYVDKVDVLLAVWENVAAFITQLTPEVKNRLFDFLFRHTLNIVLHGDWLRLNQAIKTHLSVMLQRCVTHLTKNKSVSAPICSSILNLVSNPWGHPTLNKLIHNKSTSREEVQEYIQCENGLLLLTRLEMLIESKCEDLALHIAETCLKSMQPSNSVSTLNNMITVGSKEGLGILEVESIRDVYLALLFHFKRNQDIIALFKKMDLRDGLKLVQSYRNKNMKISVGSRLWKNSFKIAEIALHAFLVSAMIQPVVDGNGSELLRDLIFQWTEIYRKKLSDNHFILKNMIRKIIQTAESSQHIYIFCQVLNDVFANSLKTFFIELYVVALTANMNEVEYQKVKNDQEKVKQAEMRLSDGFLQLADLVQDNLGVCRECVLTAFSLNPTRECFERICSLAVACGKVIQTYSTENEKISEGMVQDKDASSRMNHIDVNNYVSRDNRETVLRIDTEQNNFLYELNDNQNVTDISLPPIKELNSNSSVLSRNEKKERTLDALLQIKGNVITESLNYDVLSAPSQVLDAEALGLTPHLLCDLATVISSPRYKMLSWVLDWTELQSICEMYLLNSEEVRNTKKELKFLNIDYTQFKDWPDANKKDIYGWIEKGYEQCIKTDEYYFPLIQVKTLEESNSSDFVIASKRNIKSSKRHRIDSTDSDYKTPKKTKIMKSVYKESYLTKPDLETEFEDSRTDSARCHSFQLNIPKKIIRNHQNCNTLLRKKLVNNESKSISANGIVNDSIRDTITSDVLTINSTIFENVCTNKEFQENCVTHFNPLLNVNKKNKFSDPHVLKMLRMFRRKPSDHLTNNHKTTDSVPIGEIRKSKINQLEDYNDHIILPRITVDENKILSSPKNGITIKDDRNEMKFNKVSLPIPYIFTNEKNWQNDNRYIGI